MNSAWIRKNPDQNLVLPALASLLVPGLGQVMLGQTVRGLLLFVCSALVCFGGGLCNLALAWDAYCLAKDRRTLDITTSCQSDLMKRVWRVYEIAMVPVRLVRAVRAIFGLR
jgi:TM2 domain-containing membrane protein YozV